MVKEQIITENYAIYNSDCMYVLPSIPDKSIDLSVYSPPFAGLYNYSSHENDFSNCESKEQFLLQYEYLIKEIARVTKSGRITAVHCQDILTNTTAHDLWDFPHEIITLHEKYGFHYRNRITIWKEPLEVRMRTMVKSLMHKAIVENSSTCFTAVPDYVLIFVKAGESEIPVTHPLGFTEYYGKCPMLPEMEEKYGSWTDLVHKWSGHKDPATNKLSHVIWQRYASSVWDDIDGKNVLPFKDSKEEDDEKHVHPLQLDIIARLVELYSNKNETILDPFNGVGSTTFQSVKMGRKGLGVELKDSYFKQSVLNMQTAEELSKNSENKLF